MVTKLTVLVPEELHRQARAVAALKGENISNIVREALAEYVAEALRDPAAQRGGETRLPSERKEEIDQQFARQVSEFIERYRPALEALAK